MAHRLSTVAKRLLNLFGKRGKHWIQGNEEDGEGNFCLIGGMKHLGMQEMRKPLEEEIEKFTKGDYDAIEDFNDSTGWKSVKNLLCTLAFPKKKGVKRATTKAKA